MHHKRVVYQNLSNCSYPVLGMIHFLLCFYFQLPQHSHTFVFVFDSEPMKRNAIVKYIQFMNIQRFPTNQERVRKNHGPKCIVRNSFFQHGLYNVGIVTLIAVTTISPVRGMPYCSSLSTIKYDFTLSLLHLLASVYRLTLSNINTQIGQVHSHIRTRARSNYFYRNWRGFYCPK